MGFPRQKYWSELPFHSPGDLPNLATKPMSPASPALTGGFFTTKPPGKPTWEAALKQGAGIEVLARELL